MIWLVLLILLVFVSGQVIIVLSRFLKVFVACRFYSECLTCAAIGAGQQRAAKRHRIVELEAELASLRAEDSE